MMSNKLVDNLITLRILFMLVQPFKESKAYATGVIDELGNVLVKSADRTQIQKESYGPLDRMVYTLKRLLAKLPGGDTKLKSIIAGFWLIKESYENGRAISEERLDAVITAMNGGVILVEEEFIVKQSLLKLQEDGEVVIPIGDGAANTTGDAVSTDVPKPLLKKKILRRKPII